MGARIFLTIGAEGDAAIRAQLPWPIFNLNDRTALLEHLKVRDLEVPQRHPPKGHPQNLLEFYLNFLNFPRILLEFY